MEKIFNCTCGNKIKNEDVTYWNGTNELGEEFSEYDFECQQCGLSVNFNEWGSCDSALDAIEKVHDHISSI